MLDKELKTPNLTIRQLVNIAVICAIVYFTFFSNYTGSGYLEKQNIKLQKDYDVLDREIISIKNDFSDLKGIIERQDSVIKIKDYNIKKIKNEKNIIKKKHEKTINYINNLSGNQLDSTIYRYIK